MWTRDIQPHLVIPAAQTELTAHAAGRRAVVFTDAILEETHNTAYNQRQPSYNSTELSEKAML